MYARRSETVLVPCRLHVGSTWCDASIHQVAPRLLVISSTGALEVGSYVDIRRGTLIIIGRVSWARGARFGIRTQDNVTAHALVNEPRLAQRPGAGTGASNAVERRGAGRARAPLSVAARAERSRRLSSALQFIALTAATGGGAYVLASQLHVALSEPFARISAALGG